MRISLCPYFLWDSSITSTRLSHHLMNSCKSWTDIMRYHRRTHWSLANILVKSLELLLWPTRIHSIGFLTDEIASHHEEFMPSPEFRGSHSNTILGPPLGSFWYATALVLHIPLKPKPTLWECRSFHVCYGRLWYHRLQYGLWNVNRSCRCPGCGPYSRSLCLAIELAIKLAPAPEFELGLILDALDYSIHFLCGILTARRRPCLWSMSCLRNNFPWWMA